MTCNLPASALGNREENYLGCLKEVKFQPVFIVGPHRSGTTILYRVLSLSGCFNQTTAYHILYRQNLLQLHFTGQQAEAKQEVARLFASKHLSGGQHNSAPLDPDLPEEYCFALPQTRRIVVSPQNREMFIEFCKKLQVIQDPSRPLLLKNPYDTLNFLYLHEAFPEGRFIFIYRNPVDVVNSQVRLLRAMFEKTSEYHALMVDRYRRLCQHPWQLKIVRAFYSEGLPFLAHQSSRYVSRNCDYVLANVDKLRDTAIGVTYAQLCNEPNETVRRVLRFLDLQEAAPPDYSKLIQSKDPPMARDVERVRGWILKRNQDYCRRFEV